MTSARGGPVEGDKARALGADAFLAKPLTLAALRETVARLLADQDREVNA
jgi:CheY-like chemotaxis protein